MLNKNDLDKSIAKSLPALENNELKEAQNLIDDYLKRNRPFRYLMLLSNELHYYTIFDTEVMITDIGIARKLIEFITLDSYLQNNIGAVKLIEEADNYIEIWIGECHFALFVCDSFIVKM